MKIRSMPADGDCLFWALGHYYEERGPTLRRILSKYIRQNGKNIRINDTPFSDWIQWSEGISYKDYADHLRDGLWGGALEMALFNAITGSAISVWEPRDKKLVRIAHFDGDDKPHCHLVYMGRNHYGVLV